jgi:hypothetical protein
VLAAGPASAESDGLQASASAWQRQVLDELIADVERLIATIPRMRERRAFALRIESDSRSRAACVPHARWRARLQLALRAPPKKARAPARAAGVAHGHC